MRKLHAIFGALGAMLAASGAQAATEAVVATVDKGDTAWMMIATVLVIAMTIPGLALFYGGLVRAKNMLSVLMQVFVVFALIVILWAAYGYSLAFSGTNAFIGSFDKLFLLGVGKESLADTFTAGVKIPEFVFIAFQATFAAITCGLIVGSFAERIRFSAVLVCAGCWFWYSYLPIAHMVWFEEGLLF
jgi:Amt family ammonium transporter